MPRGAVMRRVVNDPEGCAKMQAGRLRSQGGRDAQDAAGTQQCREKKNWLLLSFLAQTSHENRGEHEKRKLTHLRLHPPYPIEAMPGLAVPASKRAL